MDPVSQIVRSGEGETSSAYSLSEEFFAVLSEAYAALLTLPADISHSPVVQRLGAAVQSGRTKARREIERSGGVAIAGALMQASSTFRSTGHFRQCAVLERAAFAIAGWERRRNPRRR